MRIRYAIIAAPVLLFGVYQRRRRAKLSMVRAIQYAGWRWKKLRFRQLAAMHGDGQRRRRLLRAERYVSAGLRQCSAHDAPPHGLVLPHPRPVSQSLPGGHLCSESFRWRFLAYSPRWLSHRRKRVRSRKAQPEPRPTRNKVKAKQSIKVWMSIEGRACPGTILRRRSN